MANRFGHSTNLAFSEMDILLCRRHILQTRSDGTVTEKKLKQIYDRIYTGKIRRVIRRTGLNRLLSKPFWKIAYWTSQDVTTHEIGDQKLSFRTDTYTEYMRFNDLAGEHGIIDDVLGSLSEDDVFYDIGANVGTYTCFAASKLRSGRVISFEPEPRNATGLRENLDLNSLDAEIIEVALSDTDGTAQLGLGGVEAGEGKHSITTDDADGDTIQVETARGDSIIAERELPAPTVVKIDVEGAELPVLHGMRDTLQEKCRLVYVEVHPEEMGDGTTGDVSLFLKERGFDVEVLTHRGSQRFLRGSK